jgi:P4 family phage/plasmid primase-like protien
MSKTVEIPIQLCKGDLRFCKVAKMGKRPVEKGWQKNGYQYNDPALLQWLAEGGNYGSMGGFGDLVIFDADDLQRLQELGIMDKFPNTLVARTPGRGGWHVYLICPGIGKKQALYDPEKKDPDGKFLHVSDIVGKGMQAVGPGSLRLIKKEGGDEVRSYEIIKDAPIAEITLEQFKGIIEPLRAKASEKVELAPVGLNNQPVVRWIDSLHVEDVLLPDPVAFEDLDGTGEIQGVHPLHGSDNGRNFSINVRKNQWCCYRCDSGGGPWELLAIKEGILDCSEAQKGWRRKYPEKWQATLNAGRRMGLPIPDVPYGENVTELRRDIIRYAVQMILGSENVKTLESGEILLYEDGAYKFGGELKLASMIQDMGGMGCTNNVVEEVLGMIRRKTRCSFLDFDTDPYRISVKNGILDIRTGELETHTPEYLTVVQLPVRYDPKADCPEVKRFLSQIVAPDMVPILEEIAGYTLLRDHPIHKGFVLLGEGRNGKSTFINLIVDMIGLEHCSSVPLQQLDKKFKLAELQGKLMNFYTDLPDATLGMTAAFKIVTSGDPITIEKKYKDPEKIIPYAKQVFGANALPKSLDESYGFISRLILVDFPNRFEGDDADIYLSERLKLELSGFLNLAILGLKRLLENQKFSYDKSVDELTREYRWRSTPALAVIDFITDVFLRQPEQENLKEDVWNAYLGWCCEQEYSSLSREAFFRGLYAGYPVITTRAMVDGKRRQVIKGLEFTDEGARLRDLGASLNSRVTED